ncbi:MAG: NPCBM/NEW2 domain-containing protein [Thermoanaerobaculales bacterium]|nr:NPCBM/NEW2 domain-containing protein [Thermoanaerobaculales bacterium]
MALIHLLQRIAALVSARDAIAVVLFATTFGTAVWAFSRAPSGLRRHRLALGAVALGALALFVAPRGWLPIPALAFMTLAIIAGFGWHGFSDQRTGVDRAAEESVPRHGTRLWIGVASILTALFLFVDLGGYSGTLLNWEPESMRGLVEASKNNVSWMRFAASRLLWGEGLVSAGHDSLLFGSGTYALWKLVRVSPTTLRLMAALLAVACLPTVYGVGRAVGGRRVATAALVVIAVNPVLLFYGRYGTSLTATIFAVLLLLWVCLRLMNPALEGWRYGLAAAGSAFLATLGYATGRVVAVAMVATTLLFGAQRWRQLERDRRRMFLVLVIALAAVWLAQSAFDRSREFINVNSEHIMMSDIRPEWVEYLLGEDVDPTRLTLNERLLMTRKVMSAGLADVRKILSFQFLHSTDPWLAVGGDPPEFPLAQGPVLLFALWGFSLSLAAWRRRWPLLLLAALAAATLPLLLTNRVDVHRVSLAVLPIIVWAAMGLAEASRVLLACRVSPAVANVVAAILLMLVAVDNSTFLFYAQPPQPSPLVSTLRSEIDSTRNDVIVGVSDDFKSEAEVALILLDRQRIDHGDRGELLWEEAVEALTDEGGPDPMTIVRIEGMLHDATVVLSPLQDFDTAIDDLRARGMSARPIGEERTGLWRLDRLPRGKTPDIETVEAAPDLNPRPRRSRATPDRSNRQRLPLIEVRGCKVYSGFEPPRFATARNGEAVNMAGGAYRFGIGMQAWTHMLFTVPHQASALEATIGFSESVSGCDRALVTFEVWGNDDRRIFDSGPFTAGMAPRRISVPLDGASTITLVVTEAGNGHECDEVFWAEPVFKLAR